MGTPTPGVKNGVPKGNFLKFQSFAFSPNSSGLAASDDDTSPNAAPHAQVAFLNAVADDEGKPEEQHLTMQDRLQSKRAATREESIMFNRVYAIEEGRNVPAK